MNDDKSTENLSLGSRFDHVSGFDTHDAADRQNINGWEAGKWLMLEENGGM